MKIDRLLEIIIIMLNNDIITGKQLAQKFEVSIKTIQRDITTLTMAGIPIVALAGAKGGYSILENYKLKNNFIKKEDLGLITMALTSLSTSYEDIRLTQIVDKYLSVSDNNKPKIYLDYGVTKDDAATDRYRSIVSAKHCAVAAGLGRIGRNTLLITPEYGNMVWLCAVLLDTAFEPDEMLLGPPCPKGCSLCIDNCPVHALGAAEMKQTVCHAYAFGGENGGDWKIKCNKCRTVCPSCFGSKNAT